MESDELKIESFMAKLSEYESDIRYLLTWDGDPQRVETVDELIKFPYEDEGDVVFITLMENKGFSKDVDYYGFVFLRTLNKLRENIFTEKYLPSNYVVWLMNVSFLAAYTMGKFYASLEGRMKSFHIGPPQTLEQLAAFAKHFIHHGKPKGDLPQTVSMREAYGSFYDRTRVHPSWKEFFNEWKKHCRKKDSNIKGVRISDGKIYYKMNGQDTERDISIKHFKNLRTKFEAEKESC